MKIHSPSVLNLHWFHPLVSSTQHWWDHTWNWVSSSPQSKREIELERVQWRPTAMLKGLENLCYAERLRETGPFSQEKSRLWTGILSVYLKGGCREIRARLFRGAQWQDQRQWTQTETWNVQSEHQEILVHCGGAQALPQIAQRVVEFPYLHMLKWWLGMVLAPGCRWCLSRLLDQIGSRGPCHLWQLCDSVLCCMNKYFNGRKQMCLFFFGME